MQASADDKLKITKTLKFFFDREDHIVGIGENAGDQHNFSPFPTMF